MKLQLILGHIGALLLGGGIYILCRTSNLLMFNWIDFLTLTDFVNELRYYTLQYSTYFPDWVIYSLPDGLWVFSYLSLSLFTWKNILTTTNMIWIFIIPVLAIGSELAQWFEIVPGTFDPTDLVLYLIGSTLPFLFYKISFDLNLPIYET